MMMFIIHIMSSDYMMMFIIHIMSSEIVELSAR